MSLPLSSSPARDAAAAFPKNPENEKGHLRGRDRVFSSYMAISFLHTATIIKKKGGNKIQPPPANTPEWQL